MEMINTYFVKNTQFTFIHKFIGFESRSLKNLTNYHIKKQINKAYHKTSYTDISS